MKQHPATPEQDPSTVPPALTEAAWIIHRASGCGPTDRGDCPPDREDFDAARMLAEAGLLAARVSTATRDTEWDCDNFTEPATCLSAGVTITARCGRCRLRLMLAEETVRLATGVAAGDDLRDRVAALAEPLCKAICDLLGEPRILVPGEVSALLQQALAASSAPVITAGDDLRDRVAALARVVDALDDEHYAAMGGGSKYCREGSCAECAAIARLNAVLTASSAPVVSRPEATDERRFRDEWADYFEHWTQAVGPEPLTVETVIAILRAEHKPFGVAAAASLAADPETTHQDPT